MNLLPAVVYVLYEIRHERRHAEVLPSLLTLRHLHLLNYALRTESVTVLPSVLPFIICGLKPRQRIHFSVFIFSVFQFGSQNIFSWSQAPTVRMNANPLCMRPAGCRPLLYWTYRLVFFCNAHNELYVSEEGNMQNAICEILNTGKKMS
jgi:hypothetical protein